MDSEAIEIFLLFLTIIQVLCLIVGVVLSMSVNEVACRFSNLFLYSSVLLVIPILIIHTTQ